MMMSDDDASSSPVPSHHVISGIVVNNNSTTTTTTTTNAMSASSSSSSSSSSTTSYKPFWHYETVEIENWIRKLTPGVANTGGMLFVPLLVPVPSSSSSSSYIDSDGAASSLSRVVVGDLLVSNLIYALSSASSSSSHHHHYHHATISEEEGRRRSTSITNDHTIPDPKRPKLERERVGDAYNILDPTFAHSSMDGGITTSSSTELGTGAILSRLTLGGLANGLAGTVMGIVDTITCIPLSSERGGSSSSSTSTRTNTTKEEERKRHFDMIIPTAYNLTVRELIQLARGLHRSIAAR